MKSKISINCDKGRAAGGIRGRPSGAGRSSQWSKQAILTLQKSNARKVIQVVGGVGGIFIRIQLAHTQLVIQRRLCCRGGKEEEEARQYALIS